MAMVEAAYRAAGLDARYVNCEVAPADLGDAVRGARAMGWAGFNCSIPHKVAVIDHLDELAPSASIIGAVNCVVRRDDRLIGENTDGQGFVASLRTVVDPAGKHVVVLGAGGAARAITRRDGPRRRTSITVVNATPSAAGARPPARRAHAGGGDVRAVGRSVSRARRRPTSSSTPRRSGCPPTSTPASTSTSARCAREMIVADVIPNPPTTHLLQRRRSPRLPDARRPRHARQPGGARHQAVDRRRCRQRGDVRRRCGGSSSAERDAQPANSGAGHGGAGHDRHGVVGASASAE